MIAGKHTERADIDTALIAAFGDRLGYLLAPASGAATLEDLSSYGRGAAELKNGAALTDDLLRDDYAAVQLDGTNDYIDTGWATRTNLVETPFFNGLSGEANPGRWAPETRCTAVSSPDWFLVGNESLKLTTTEVVANDYGCRARCSVGYGKSAVPCTAGVTYTMRATVKTGVKRRCQIGAHFYDAEGTEIAAYPPQEVVEVAADTPTELVREFTAPTGAVYFMPLLIYRPAEVGEVVYWDKISWAQGTRAELESVDFFPTPAQLESGEAGWSGTAHESASDIGPFARGTERTYVMLANRTSSASTHVLFGGISAQGEALYLPASTSPQWRPKLNKPVGWTSAWPGNGQTVCVALVHRDGALTATLHIDGEELETKAVESFSPPGSESSPAIGSNLLLGYNGGSPFLGSMLPFAVFLDALTAEEVVEVEDAFRTSATTGSDGTVVATTVTAPDYGDGLVPKLSALLDGGGAGSGVATLRGGLWDTDGTLLAVTEEIEIGNGDPEGWYDLTFEDPPTWPSGEERVIGLHFGGVANVARWFLHADTDGLLIDDAYSDGTDDYVPAEADDQEPSPMLFATFVVNPELPAMEDLYYGRLGHYSAQEVLSMPGAPVEHYRTRCGWHGTWLDPEPQGASFAIVDREGELADLVGERIRVSAYGRSVVAYVHRSTELDSGDVQLSLSRRAFAALAVLSTEELPVKVEVLD